MHAIDYLTFEYQTDHNLSCQKETVRISHSALKTEHTLSAVESSLLQSKVWRQASVLETYWNQLSERQQRIKSSEGAHRLTREATAALYELEHLLQPSLALNRTPDWNELIPIIPFTDPDPRSGAEERLAAIARPKPPFYRRCGAPPVYADPDLTLSERFFSALRQKRLDKARERHAVALEEWRLLKAVFDQENTQLERYHQSLLRAFEERVAEEKRIIEADSRKWEKAKAEYDARQVKIRTLIERLDSDYRQLKPAAVIEYADLVLSRLPYPVQFPRSIKMDYHPERKRLSVDYALPSPEDLPTLSRVTYNGARNEYEETHRSEAEQLGLYARVIDQIVLRTLYELFETDQVAAFDSIHFTGWVSRTPALEGKNPENRLLALRVPKEAFQAVDLAGADPGTCLSNLKKLTAYDLSLQPE